MVLKAKLQNKVRKLCPFVVWSNYLKEFEGTMVNESEGLPINSELKLQSCQAPHRVAFIVTSFVAISKHRSTV